MSDNDKKAFYCLQKVLLSFLLIGIVTLLFWVSSLSSRLDEVEVKVEEFEQTVGENSSRISDLETSVEESKSQIDEIKDELNL